MVEIYQTRLMVGPEGQEVKVAAHEVDVWIAKGFKLAEVPKDIPKKSEETIPEDPRKPYLDSMKLSRIRRLAADLGLSEANMLPKEGLIEKILETSWAPPTEMPSEE